MTKKHLWNADGAYFDLSDPGSVVLYKSVQISGTTVLKAELALVKRPADSWSHGQTPEMSSAFGLPWKKTLKWSQIRVTEQKQDKGASWHADSFH